MPGSEQMRAAWSRRTDEELLRAFFLEELSAEGRRVVGDLFVEKHGPIHAFVNAFVLEQGELVATVHVRNVDVNASLKDHSLPLMRGLLILTANGIGFIPAGHDDELGADDLSSLGDIAFGQAGTMVGVIGNSILTGLRRTMRPVASRTTADIPLPLLAKIETNAVWLPHAAYDELLWGPDFGELVRAGERLIALTPLEDVEAIVADWAERHHIALTTLDPAPLLR